MRNYIPGSAGTVIPSGEEVKYPPDLTDEQWNHVQAVLASRNGHSSRLQQWPLRAV